MIRRIFLYNGEKFNLRAGLRNIYLLFMSLFTILMMLSPTPPSLNPYAVAYVTFAHVPMIAVFWTPIFHKTFLNDFERWERLLSFAFTLVGGPIVAGGLILLLNEVQESKHHSPLLRKHFAYTGIAMALLGGGVLLVGGEQLYWIIGVLLFLPIFRYQKVKYLTTDKDLSDRLDEFRTGNAPCIALEESAGATIDSRKDGSTRLKRDIFPNIGLSYTNVYAVEDENPLTYSVTQFGFTMAKITYESIEESDTIVEQFTTRRLPIAIILGLYVQQSYEKTIYQDLGYTHKKIENKLLLR